MEESTKSPISIFRREQKRSGSDKLALRYFERHISEFAFPLVPLYNMEHENRLKSQRNFRFRYTNSEVP